MNKKRGAVLIFSLLVTGVLTTLLTSFFFSAIGEREMASRYAYSTQAFWLAEAGIAQVVGTSGLSSASGYVGSSSQTYNAQVTHLVSNYYRIVSVGNVSLPSGKNYAHTIEGTIKTGSVSGTKFKYGIETTTDLVMKGSVDINPNDSWKEYSVLDFPDLFGVSKADMRDNATHLYTDATFAEPVEGITWVDVAGSGLTIAGNLTGSGILVINGNAHFSGTVDFYGIIYVIGELTITGTVTTNGSVLAESSMTVDTELKGNVTINYSSTDITDALTWVSFINKEVVSWKET